MGVSYRSVSMFGAARPRYTAVAVDLGLTLGGSGPTARAREPAPPVLDDESAIVAALADGDAHVLEAVYHRYSRGVYSMAMRLLGDGPAAEEVVQETFLKLWRQPSAYQPARGHLFAWLLGVAHHHAVDLLRRRQLEQRHSIVAGPNPQGDGLVDLIDSRGIASNDGDPQARVGALEQRLAVGRALARLPQDQRIPLELAYYRGLTQVEIASRLGVPLGTIKTRMRLGLQQLRRAPELSALWSER